jgi:hypothetical protein
MLLFASSTRRCPFPGADALVVVVDRDGEDLLRRILPDHVLVEDVADFLRRRQLALGPAAGSAAISSRMMSLHSSMHSSQMKTEGRRSAS